MTLDEEVCFRMERNVFDKSQRSMTDASLFRGLSLDFSLYLCRAQSVDKNPPSSHFKCVDEVQFRIRSSAEACDGFAEVFFCPEHLVKLQFGFVFALTDIKHRIDCNSEISPLYLSLLRDEGPRGETETMTLPEASADNQPQMLTVLENASFARPAARLQAAYLQCTSRAQQLQQQWLSTQQRQLYHKRLSIPIPSSALTQAATPPPITLAVLKEWSLLATSAFIALAITLALLPPEAVESMMGDYQLSVAHLVATLTATAQMHPTSILALPKVGSRSLFARVHGALRGQATIQAACLEEDHSSRVTGTHPLHTMPPMEDTSLDALTPTRTLLLEQSYGDMGLWFLPEVVTQGTAVTMDLHDDNSNYRHTIGMLLRFSGRALVSSAHLSPGLPHLIFYIHGLQGSHSNLRLLRSHLAQLAPNAVHILIDALEGNTSQPIRESGEVLAREIVQILRTRGLDLQADHPTALLSFVGHSLGALIVRAAIASKTLRNHAAQLRYRTLLSLAAPHFGSRFGGSKLVRNGARIVSAVRQGALRDLCLGGGAEALLEINRLAPFGRFDCVVLISSSDDKYVPWLSARAQIDRRVLMTDKHSSVIVEMAAEAWKSPLPALSIRADVGFGSLKGYLSHAVGRPAHLALIEDEKAVRIIAIRYSPLFQ